jgi:hypothetical protein
VTELSAEIDLRPVRIGFFVKPTDLASVRAIMTACTTIWGGLYNPIIPVFRTLPKDWRADRFDRVRGAGITRGYVRFFEPDVYVEAEDGLVERATLGSLREQHVIYPQVIPLREFLEPEQEKNWAEPAFGLNINDALRQIYRTEQQFVPRDKHEALLVFSMISLA